MKKYILFFFPFVISMAVAFVVTSLVKDNESDPPPPPVDYLPEVRLQMVSLEKTGQNLYTLVVQAQNLPETISATYHISELEKQANSDGCFENLPGNESGTYTVELLDSNVDTLLAQQVFEGFALEQIPEPEPKEKPVSDEPLPRLTAADLKSLIVAGNVSDHRIARNVKLTVFGLRDDKKPAQLIDIYEKIENGFWESVKVFDDIEYDSKGRVYAVTIQPIYPNQ